MVDRAQKVRNGFAIRLLIVAVAAFGLAKGAMYLFGDKRSPEAVEISDFAEARIDRFYHQADGEPIKGMSRPHEGPMIPALDQ